MFTYKHRMMLGNMPLKGIFSFILFLAENEWVIFLTFNKCVLLRFLNLGGLDVFKMYIF